MIKAIFFDLYGTLAGFSPSRFDIQSRAAADFGIKLTEEGVLRGYAAADAFMAEQNLSEPLRTLGSDGKREFFAEYERRVLRGSGVEVDVETAAAVWRRVREIPYEMTIYADVEPVLTALRQSGLTLGVISNMNRTGEALAEDLGLTDLVDFVVTSLEVGAEKPNPAIFNAALARARVESDEAVHVGDQLTSDIEGARGIGIHPVFIDRDGNHPDYCDAPKIAGLSELAGVFEGL
jgi:putative hydrolase of the HAD superfamily